MGFDRALSGMDLEARVNLREGEILYTQTLRRIFQFNS